VEDIIKAAVGSVQERFKHAGCQFELRVESGLPQVFADADAITTVLINLLDNAHKFSEDIKHIVLSAQTAQGCIVISVKDNGIGMGARDRRRIFRQFYQAEHELARRGGGCGLGLSIVQSIVAAHGGRVEVESAVGLGSTFSVYLPLAPGQPSRQEAIAG
jgi:signal transduction histidine kinase